MAKQEYDAYDAFDSHDESATDQAPEAPANTPSDTPAHNAAERPELASSKGAAKGKPNKQAIPQKTFDADAAPNDVVSPAESVEAAETAETNDANDANDANDVNAINAIIDYGATPDEALVKLEEQGFSEDEALRLLGVSDRQSHSKEAIEAQETLRRLKFTRWLVERGLLSEYPA